MRALIISIFCFSFSTGLVAQKLNNYIGLSVVIFGDAYYKIIPVELNIAHIDQNSFLSFKIKAGYSSYSNFGSGDYYVSTYKIYSGSDVKYDYSAQGFYIKLGYPIIKHKRKSFEYNMVFYDDVSFTNHNLTITVNDPVYGKSTAYGNSKSILSFISGLEIENAFIVYPSPSFGIFSTIAFGYKIAPKPFDDDVPGVNLVTNYNAGTPFHANGSPLFSSICLGIVYRFGIE